METTGKFQRLNEVGNSLYLTSAKPFNPQYNLNKHSIACLTWAYNNAYFGYFKGASSSKHQTMLDAFLGKMGECATYEYFKELGYELDYPEMITRQKGEWDDGDLVVGGQKIQIKTTLFTSNFLLIKKSDWDMEGNYKWGSGGKDASYGAFYLCRVFPNHKFVLNSETLEELTEECKKMDWKGEVTGFITKKDFILGMSENFVIPSGKKINGSIKCSTELVYFQAGDLKDPFILPKKI